ncbi:prefoldin, putative [Trypanosoma equiperdum]|uniref:Prefoldin subunit 3 n=2 Tax=Trypanozoon TaxID=39700 RepID=Q57TZ7_TRYB2|nr:prefoldin, putative [Trypanosoma brucei brucei TREU927]AAX70921.1 prefoldin, putative [Trypanosoma brucei]AAZ12122.1 prefoldin, putative [Trypanosoma brucei brucei TREU927]SCU65939.1 prefoldin, putative [Trypanosoma equiperdum]
MEKYEFPEDYVNPRNIPRIAYIPDVAAYVSNGGGADTVISNLLMESSKYEHMEKRLVSSLANLDYKIPTIKKTLNSLEFLQKQLEEAEQQEEDGKRAGIRSYYCLTDSVFGEAIVRPQKTVHLWMGAKVMVEYTFEEASALLKKNLSNAEVNMRNTKEDLAWLQEQITNLQINISRVYNYDLKNKRAKDNKKETSEK